MYDILKYQSDLDTFGLRGSGLLNEAMAGVPLPEYAAKLFDLSHALGQQGRHLDQMAALHLAKRFTAGADNINLLDSFIANNEKNIPSPVPGYRIINKCDDPVSYARFSEEAGGFNPFVSTEIAEGIYRSMTSFEDLSFVIMRESTGQYAVVRCSLVGSDKITCFGHPIRLALSCPPDERLNFALVVIDYLRFVCLKFGANSVLVENELACDVSLLQKATAKYPYSMEVYSRVYVDLTQDESVLLKSVRKKYRQYINWGRKHIEIKEVTGGMITDVTKALIIDLVNKGHERVAAEAGKDLENVPRLHHLIELCRQGKGQVYVGLIDGNTVCGTAIFTEDRDCTQYYVAAYPDFGEGQKTAHFIVWNALMRAKARNLRRAYITYIYPPDVKITSLNSTGLNRVKDRSMNFFKVGFSETAEFYPVTTFYFDPRPTP